MELKVMLAQYNNSQLIALSRFTECRYTQKKRLINCLFEYLTDPSNLRQQWEQLEDLSQKVILSAYHNGGQLNKIAFEAQYQQLPHTKSTNNMRWISLLVMERIDLFILRSYGYVYSDADEWTIAPEIMATLANFIPVPERFQLEGTTPPKHVTGSKGAEIEMTQVNSEQIGLHDLVAYLRLVEMGRVRCNARNKKTTSHSMRYVLDNLLQGDYFSLPEKYRVTDLIRPYGLDRFARGGELVKIKTGELVLTPAGREFYQNRDPEILLEAFETWTESDDMDELEHISGLTGLNARSTRLTPPSKRRAKIIEALSWCPAHEWLAITDFYRAIKAWYFDFEIESTAETHLKAFGADYYVAQDYWRWVKQPYIDVILWEELVSIGALDLLYIPAEESTRLIDNNSFRQADSYYSLFDGLLYFRINNLGAYLLGQAYEYVPSGPKEKPLFTMQANFRLKLIDTPTPNAQSYLEQLARPLDEEHYQLDTQALLDTLELGGDADFLYEFLRVRNNGPLPDSVKEWFTKLLDNSNALKFGGEARFIKVKSAKLTDMLANDDKLKRYCFKIDSRTLVVSTRRERAFRNRLKELEYIILG